MKFKKNFKKTNKTISFFYFYNTKTMKKFQLNFVSTVKHAMDEIQGCRSVQSILLFTQLFLKKIEK